jgi:hypothetical protein
MARGVLERGDVERLVDKWARTASERQGGGAYAPMLEEFDFGFVAWVRPPEGVRPEPDSSACHVIDRVSGKIIPWGSIPPEMVADAYRRGRPPQGPPPVTADPVASIRRAATLGHAPTVAAHLMLPSDRVLHIAYGAKGDQELNHHPLIRQWLDSVPADHLARGVERHAEVIVMSDALHANDALTGRTTSLDEARGLFARAIRYQVTTVTHRAAGGGKPAASCMSCYATEVHFGIFRPGVRSLLEEAAEANDVRYRGVGGPDLPAEVRAVLTEERTTPRLPAGSRAQQQYYSRLDDTVPDVPANRLMTERWESFMHHRAVPGQDHRLESVLIMPAGFGQTYSVVEPYAARLGSQVLYPIGKTQGSESVVVGDERGRVFIIDQAGEWFVGHTIDEAMVSFVLGRAKARIRDDGTW